MLISMKITLLNMQIVSSLGPGRQLYHYDCENSPQKPDLPQGVEDIPDIPDNYATVDLDENVP